jgi:hypothetical protein
MVTRTSYTPTLGLIDCWLSSSNFIHVKYPQMLTHMIVTYIVIQSSSTTPSKNNSLLLKEFNQVKTQYNELQRWQLEWVVQKKNEMGLCQIGMENFKL